MHHEFGMVSCLGWGSFVNLLPSFVPFIFKYVFQAETSQFSVATLLESEKSDKNENAFIQISRSLFLLDQTCDLSE